MYRKTLNLLLLLIVSLMIFSCNSKQSKQNNRIIIGVADDVQSFNTLFAFSYVEGAISELLYPGLVGLKWNKEKGEPYPFPMISKSWLWAEDSSAIKFVLREDIYWTDGQKLTAEDVVFSFDVFSDPEVQSRLYGTFDQFYIKSNGSIDVEKAFKVVSPYEIIIYFPQTSVPDLIELVIPIIPKHVYENIERAQLTNHESNYNPVSSGAFKLKSWERNQAVILEADSGSFLFQAGQVPELVFKIVPDYTSRILQLKKSELDLVEQVKAEDADELRKEDQLVVVPVFGREYDYIGWNNIDPSTFSKGKTKPNKFFGNSNIRKALSMAISRKEILDEYLLGLGELAATPVSSIFKSAFNPEVKPYEFNPDEAKNILALEGWTDEDLDRILEKDGEEFRFTLYYPVGNPLREYASQVVKNNLKSVGIDVNLEKMELGAFIDNLYGKKFDAWMAAWYIPIPLELKPYWYSDPNVSPLNFVSYNNYQIDKILDQLETRISMGKKNDLVQEFQSIIHEDEPVTFLYWKPNIIVYNKRLKNLNITPFAVIEHCWEWTLDE